ncbi:MAG: hypothetical protein M1840_001237 [Geoglossum simile]|nr:MAG: hypothetical protein M1840_001237 [Geoglossum simile]
MTSSIFRRGRAPSAEDDGNLGLTHLNPSLDTNASGLGDQKTPFEVDIVAIHGINGHPLMTWTHEDGVCWIRDFLPGHLPGARIFTFGYESKVAFTLSTGGLGDFARSLLVALTGTRKSREERRRSIIFVCHSMGGIVVKKALIIAALEPQHFINIRESTTAILFLGTPHRGSSTTELPKVLANIARIGTSWFTGFMRPDLLRSLAKGSKELGEISVAFRTQVASMRIVSFVEQKATPPFSKRVVGDQSAIMGIPNEHIIPMQGCDHCGICRFASESSHSYKAVRNVLEEVATDATDRINGTGHPRHTETGKSQVKSFCVIPFERNKDMDHQTAAIWGIGGAGKTQIALEYAHRRRESTSCSVFWVHASNAARFSQSYAEIAKLAELPLDVREEELLNAVRLWIERQDNWLLVLDNADYLPLFKTHADHLGLGDAHRHELLRFVPRGRTGTILWTSRDKSIAGSLVNVEQGIEVRQMGHTEALTLFRSLSHSNENARSSDSEDELLDILEGLPLAIAQATAFIRKTDITTKTYVEMLKSTADLPRLLDESYIDRYRESDVPNSVMRTWLISMEQIAKENACAYKILHTIAFFDNQGIPFELIRAAAGAGVKEYDIVIAVSRLRDFSFLQTRIALGQVLPSYESHRLVQLATRRSLESPEKKAEQRLFSEMAIRIMVETFPDGTRGTWDRCKAYLSHSLKAFTWKEVEELNLRVLEPQKEVLGENHPDTLSTLASLASTYSQQGRSKEAEELGLRVLELQKEVLVEKHPDTLRTMGNLASTYSQQGRLKEAEELNLRVLELQKEQGRLKEAEELSLRVLELQKEVLGEKHPDTLRTMGNLASTYWKQGRSKEAEELNLRVLELQKEVLGEKHPDTLRAMGNLASTYWKQGRSKEAEELNLRVLELRKEVLGEKHPDTPRAMGNLASTYSQQGRSKEAEELDLRVLELQRGTTST